MQSTGEIKIYKSADNETQIEVIFEHDTVWLTQSQMAELFGRNRVAITQHLGNIFKERELNKNSVCKEFLHTASDGKSYKTQYYNLDVIISVGYRVKSLRGTQFRIWATQRLKDYLIKGYSIIAENKAAHLLYFIVKNHSFTDGNKRIAAFLFLLFLQRNGLLYSDEGFKKIEDNTLVALTLMIAESKPAEKEMMIIVILNLMQKEKS